MAFENYFYVPWSQGTPVSTQRLSQMSLNIEQVRVASIDKAGGILQMNSVTANSTSWNDFANAHSFIDLKDNTSTGGVDQRVTIDTYRYYKVVLNMPALIVQGPGCEDSTFRIEIVNNTSGTANVIAGWRVVPPTFSYLNVAAATANIANEAVKSNTYVTYIGAATYSIVQTSGTGANVQVFYAQISRDAGANTNNSPAFSIFANAASPIQLYVEDAGGY